MINGGQDCNVFWQVGSSATLGTRTTFIGTIIANTSITLVTSASISGRALALNGAVALDTNVVTVAVCSGVPPPGAPTLSKAFDPATLNEGVGNVSTLTITLSNPNLSVATLSAPLIDNLPLGVTIAATPAAGTTCIGGVVAAIAGGSTVTLSGGSIPAGVGTTPGTCTVTVDVTAPDEGFYLNTLVAGALKTSKGNNAAPAIASLTVNPPVGPGAVAPTVSKSFSPATINAGVSNVSTLIIILSNSSNNIPDTILTLTDNLPTGVVIAATPNASTTCVGGTLTAVAGTGTIVLTGGTIPIAVGSTPGTCTVTVDVTAATAGPYLNTLAAGALDILEVIGGNAAPAIATLTVNPIITPAGPSPRSPSGA